MGRSQEALRRRSRTDSLSVSGTGKHPRILTRPTKAGDAIVEETITGTNGTFSGASDVTITRQWVRVVGGRQEIIAGETGATYDLTEDDEGATIIFQNTGTDEEDRATISQSTPTAVVEPVEEEE
jgi:hypothetical protein